MKHRNKNIVLENLLITDAASDGRGLARINNMVVFVPHTVPEDVVNVKIYRKKNNYAEAELLELVTPSPLRVKPFCDYFGVCGGCKWQNLSYEQQLFFKQKQVTDALTHIAKVPLPDATPILGSAQTTHYRNKLGYTFSDLRWLTYAQMDENPELKAATGLGFHVPKQHSKVVHIEKCWLLDDAHNEIRNEIYDFATKNNYEFYSTYTHKGFLRELIIRTTTNNELMLQFIFDADKPKLRNALLTHIQEKFAAVTSIFYYINTKVNEDLEGVEAQHFFGTHTITENLGHLKYEISPKSFFQTNSLQAFQLYSIIKQMAQLTGSELVYDLYTGTGSIALFLANAAKKVIGVEYVQEAINDANKNAALNGITNCDFFAGDMRAVLNEDFVAQHGAPDMIITDPPRAGMHPNVVEMMLKLAPKKILYVSCNPATQARDVHTMQHQYRVAAYQPVDMFPHTHHVENVLLLERIEVSPD